MLKRHKNYKFLILTGFYILFLPIQSFAQESNLIPCDGAACDYYDFIELINRVISFVFVYLAVPLCAIMFAYAGFLLLTSGGSTEAVGKAKNIFSNSALGLILAAAAFLIVKLVLNILGYDGSWLGF